MLGGEADATRLLTAVIFFTAFVFLCRKKNQDEKVPGATNHQTPA
jgi:hypothetical protein